MRERGQPEAREVRAPELEHPRAQLEEPCVHADVAQVDEREEESPRGRARKAGRGGDLAQRQRPALAVERADDGEPRWRDWTKSASRSVDSTDTAVRGLMPSPVSVRSTARTAASSSGGRRGRGRERLRGAELPSRRRPHLLERHARMDVGEHELARPRVAERADRGHVPPSNYLLMSACRESETAKEYGRNGVFTYFLLGALGGDVSGLTYRIAPRPGQREHPPRLASSDLPLHPANAATGGGRPPSRLRRRLGGRADSVRSHAAGQQLGPLAGHRRGGRRNGGHGAGPLPARRHGSR